MNTKVRAAAAVAYFRILLSSSLSSISSGETSRTMYHPKGKPRRIFMNGTPIPIKVQRISKPISMRMGVDFFLVIGLALSGGPTGSPDNV